MISKIEEAYDGLENAYAEGNDFVDCATEKKEHQLLHHLRVVKYIKNI